MTVHFVYSTPSPKAIIAKAYRRTSQALQRAGIPAQYLGARDRVPTDSWAATAPYSITAHAYNALRSRFHTLLYDWSEHARIRSGPQDVLIGHPHPDDTRAVWNRACLDGEFGLRIAMTPLSHRMAEVCGRIDRYVPYVDAILGIMGPYWYDTWGQSPLAHWLPKITPVDMAIDTHRFPYVRRRFNPQGKRTFLYIGWNGAQKGTHLLSILFGLLREYRCVWIGDGPDIPNVEHRPRAVFTREYLTTLAEECDFYISLGVSDANPTTILESMAWGFPVCCTPESGYYRIPVMTPLSITDMTFNVARLREMQATPDAELHKQALAARSLVQERYNWSNFTDVLFSTIDETARMKGLQI